MPRYRFSETVVYKSGNPWPTYEAGSVYDLSADFGDRWVRRSVATVDDGDGAALPDPRFPVAVTEPVADLAAGITEAVKSGEKSINQAREELGLPPIAPVIERTTRPYRTRGGV